MKRTGFFISLFLISLIVNNAGVYGDVRTEPKDIIIALDKSLSMEDKIEEVKEFINLEIIDGLIAGDYFLLLVFYGTTDVAIAKEIIDPAVDSPVLRQKVSTILADGPYTDIGNVLDRLWDEIYERVENDRKKWCFLVTDGINEPTRASKYYSPDGTFQHGFLDDLQDQFSSNGWKVQFMEIGETASAKELAEDLGVDYVQVEPGTSSTEMKTAIDDPYVTISILQESIQELAVNGRNDGFLAFEVEIEGLQRETTVSLSELNLQTSSMSGENILLGAEFSLTILPEETRLPVKIPVKVKSTLDPGDYPAQIFFTFASSEQFDEAGIAINLHKNNRFENHWWLLPLIILGGILVLAGIVFLILVLAQGKPQSFRLLVAEAPLPEDHNLFKVTKKKDLYLNESLDIITLEPKKTRKSVARISYLADGISFKPLNAFRFEDVESIPQNVINQTIKLTTLSGKLYKITFRSIT